MPAQTDRSGEPFPDPGGAARPTRPRQDPAGQRLGSVLLADALQRIVLATETVAARFVVVDAIDDAAHGFYQRHGFRAIPGTLRLVQKVSDIAAAFRT